MNTSNSQINRSKSKPESESQLEDEYNNEYNEEISGDMNYPDNNSSRRDNSQDMMGDDEDDENYQEDEYEDDEEQYQSDEEFDEEFSEGDKHKEKEESYNRETSNINNESSLDINQDYDFLPPERRIRYKLFRFVNNLRLNYRLPEFYQDSIGNKVAMAYAKYLLKEKENENILKSLAKENNFIGNMKDSTFSIFVDVGMDSGLKKSKITDYTSDFVETHSTLIEFENHRSNMLSTNLNTISFGMAYDDEKVVIVDLFTFRDLAIESLNINNELGTIVVKGHMLNEKFGVYVMRLVTCDNTNSTLALITPQNIISPDMKMRPFTGSFSGVTKILQDPSPKLLELYIREKPNTIKYNSVFTGSVKLEDLILAYRIPVEVYPNEILLREQKKDDDEEKKRIYAEMDKKRLEKEKEKAEKENRLKKIDNEYGKNFFKIGEVDEELEDDLDEDNVTQNNLNSNKLLLDIKKPLNTSNLSNPSEISDINSEVSGAETNRKQNHQKQLDRLESNIEELKRENEELQKKIRIIYDFRKKEGRDDRNYYKDSNINDSTYTDSLNSASVIHNELNTQKKILKADLEKYNQTVEIQQQRKQQIYRILMNYKEELLANSEYRKGTKISREQKDKWIEKERELEEDIKKLRIENIKSSFELNRLNKELKKLEEYFEGLHVIDFEQLKIENNTLTEKIEDRNEEIHKFKSKINSNVQVLAHLQEKFTKVNSDLKKKKEVDNVLLTKLKIKKDDLDEVKKKNENKTIKKLKMKQKIDQINSNELKEYYSKTNKGIENLISKINSVTGELLKYRNENDNDIKLLINRTQVMVEEFKKSQDEKSGINKSSE